MQRLGTLVAVCLATAACGAGPSRQPAPPDAAPVVVTGVLTGEGVECPALRGDDGRLYTLASRDLQGFAVGDRVRVEGSVAQVSFCMQGTTINPSSIRSAGR